LILDQNGLLLSFPDNLMRLITAANMRDYVNSVFGAKLPSDPTVNDDSANTAGNGFFDIQSRWFNTFAESAWICTDGTPGAAVWVKVNPLDVTVTMDPEFVVTGSPFTTDGILDLSWDLVPAGYSLQGPVSGGPAKPTFKPQSASTQVVPRSLLLNGTTQFLTFTGSEFNTVDGATWSFSVWVKTPTGAASMTVLFLYSSVSGHYLELFLSSGLAILSTSGFFGNPPDAVVSIPNDGLWHLLSGGFDASGPVFYLQLDFGFPAVGAPTAFINGLDVDTVWVGASVFGGTPHSFWNGNIQELFIYSSTFFRRDTLSIAYNLREGLYYRQVPCNVLFEITMAFELWELSGDRIDQVQGLTLVPTGAPVSDLPICGWRYGVQSAFIENVTFSNGISVTPGVTYEDAGGVPTPPPVGEILVYNNGGVLYQEDHAGVVTPVLSTLQHDCQTITGTTTDPYVTFLEITAPNYLQGYLHLQNTGIHTLRIQSTTVDPVQGTQTGNTFIAAGADAALNLFDNFNSINPGQHGVGPYSYMKLEIQSNSAGFPTTFLAWWTIIIC
jgi:hypothetical protein